MVMERLEGKVRCRGGGDMRSVGKINYTSRDKVCLKAVSAMFVPNFSWIYTLTEINLQSH